MSTPNSLSDKIHKTVEQRSWLRQRKNESNARAGVICRFYIRTFMSTGLLSKAFSYKGSSISCLRFKRVYITVNDILLSLLCRLRRTGWLPATPLLLHQLLQISFDVFVPASRIGGYASHFNHHCVTSRKTTQKLTL